MAELNKVSEVRDAYLGRLFRFVLAYADVIEDENQDLGITTPITLEVAAHRALKVAEQLEAVAMELRDAAIKAKSGSFEEVRKLGEFLDWINEQMQRRARGNLTVTELAQIIAQCRIRSHALGLPADEMPRL